MPTKIKKYLALSNFIFYLYFIKSELRMAESRSMTRALYSIYTAKQYLQDIIIDFPYIKRRVNQWINKLDFVLEDSKVILTEESRECFKRELVKGDPIQIENIFNLLCDMTPAQRSLMEKAAESLLKGELIITE